MSQERIEAEGVRGPEDFVHPQSREFNQEAWFEYLETEKWEQRAVRLSQSGRDVADFKLAS